MTPWELVHCTLPSACSMTTRFWPLKTMMSVSPSLSRKLIRRAIADHRFSMPLKSLVKTVEHAGFDVLDATPRGAQHTNEMPLGARAAYTVGTMLWHGFGVSIAPTTLVFARKKAA